VTTLLRLVRRVFADAFAIVLAAAILVVALILSVSGTAHSGVIVSSAVAVALLSGLAAMVTVQTVKQLLPLRGWFNRKQVALWLAGREGPSEDAMTLLADGLDNGGRSRFADVFNLPAEQLTAQIAMVTDQLIQQQRASAPLLEVLISAGLESRIDTETVASTEEIWSAVSFEVSAAIDQLQIYLAGRWRHYLQLTSWWLAGGFGLALAASHVINVNALAATIVALVAGGFVAWFARDLTAIAEGLRR
jgi:hypothetical protein